MQTDFDFFPIERVQTSLNSKKDDFDKARVIVNEFKNEASLFEHYNSNSDELVAKKYQKDIDKGVGQALFTESHLSNTYYTKIQKWIGHVESVQNNKFTAILKDLTNGGTDEWAEFSIDEISPDDSALISKGAAFYMYIGFVFKNGTRKRESEIRFQRLGEFDENQINNLGLDLATSFFNHFK